MTCLTCQGVLDADKSGMYPKEIRDALNAAVIVLPSRDNEDLEKGGVKYDKGKRRFDLLAVSPLEQLVDVLGYGAGKYEDANWRKGMPWGRAFAAAMRHLWAWWKGETFDPESGLNHVAHAMCNLMFLLEWQETHPELDDRVTR
jgi:hypothetical protein